MDLHDFQLHAGSRPMPGTVEPSDPQDDSGSSYGLTPPLLIQHQVLSQTRGLAEADGCPAIVSGALL